MPADHRLASRKQVRLVDLRSEQFIGSLECRMPHRNRWMIQFWQRAGFRPKLPQEGESVSHSIIVSDGVVSRSCPLICWSSCRSEATWDFLLVSQRGRTARTVKPLIELPAVVDEC
jgi:hypothetical protein